MSAELIIVAAISLFFGFLFIFPEFFQLKISLSLVSGIFIGYFFISMLPEIENLSQISNQLNYARYAWVALGFVINYLVYMFIIKKIKNKSILKLKNLSKSKERNFNSEYDKIQKDEIQEQANRKIASFHFYSLFLYHLLIGIIGIPLLLENLFSGIIFFLIAYMISLSIHNLRSRLLIADLNIREIEVEESFREKVILSITPLIGVIISLILVILSGFYLDFRIVSILFSIVAGFMLYHIVFELMPEPEKLSGGLFFAGFLGFLIFIFLVNFLSLV
ncbi:MAG: hypothetical protein AC479_07285 [miscellaneous Crenarchaeota group-6 archaeon AD8-1]|nr:MAG: hypothetical protein AC479_07285 [miscellaneous Crenarchaeota group-6 archaeon AD8-1]